MTLADFGIIAEIVSAIAVVVMLGCLALQIAQANKMAPAKTRERMVEHGTGGIGCSDERSAQDASHTSGAEEDVLATRPKPQNP